MLATYTWDTINMRVENKNIDGPSAKGVFGENAIFRDFLEVFGAPTMVKVPYLLSNN